MAAMVAGANISTPLAQGVPATTIRGDVPNPDDIERLRGPEGLAQGQRLESEGKYKEAVSAYRLAARAGNGQAARRLGEIYACGLPGFARDMSDALQWIEVARKLKAVALQPMDQYTLYRSRCLPAAQREGLAAGLPAEAVHLEAEGKFSQAMSAYRRAARNGNGPSAKRLWEMYCGSVPGVSRDLAESIYWNEAASKLGEKLPRSC